MVQSWEFNKDKKESVDNIEFYNEFEKIFHNDKYQTDFTYYFKNYVSNNSWTKNNYKTNFFQFFFDVCIYGNLFCKSFDLKSYNPNKSLKNKHQYFDNTWLTNNLCIIVFLFLHKNLNEIKQTVNAVDDYNQCKMYYFVLKTLGLRLVSGLTKNKLKKMLHDFQIKTNNNN